MGLLLLKRFLPVRRNFFYNTIFLFRFLFSQRLHPLFLFLDEKKKFAKRKIKTAPARAKTAFFRLNGNKLAALKQISVFIACRCQFLYARSDEVGSFFGSPASPECASLFLSFCPSGMCCAVPSSSLLPFFFLIYILYNNVYSIYSIYYIYKVFPIYYI